jgi:8-oxo-dGTP pyrophosphatase MutT (NUDIX family)
MAFVGYTTIPQDRTSIKTWPNPNGGPPLADGLGRGKHQAYVLIMKGSSGARQYCLAKKNLKIQWGEGKDKKITNNPGQWVIPGGNVNGARTGTDKNTGLAKVGGESLRHGAVREFKEEIGIDLKTTDYIVNSTRVEPGYICIYVDTPSPAPIPDLVTLFNQYKGQKEAGPITTGELNELKFFSRADAIAKLQTNLAVPFGYKTSPRDWYVDMLNAAPT